MRLPLPARLERVGEIGIGGPVAPLTDGRRRALEDVEVLRRGGQRGHALDATGPGAKKGDDLVRQAGERLVRPTAGVVVVPPRRVERRPGEVLHSRDGGQLHEIEDPDSQHVPAAADHVVVVGADLPSGRFLVPLGPGHSGMEKGVVFEVETVGDRLEVASDLLAERVAAGGDVIELLEHREVDVRLDVAHHARVAVPIPGSPDAARLVDDADPLEAGFAEVGAGEDPGDPPAHDDDINFVGDRVATGDRCERVVTVAGEVLVGPQVADAGPARDQPFVTFGEILGADGLWVVAGGGRIGPGHVAILGEVS